MAKNKVLVLVIAFVIAGIVAYGLIWQQARFSRLDTTPEQASAKEVICDATITNPRGIPLFKNGDLVIEAASCKQQPVKNCARFFGVFSDTGALRIDGEGGLGSSVDVEISEGASQVYPLSWCGSKLTSKFTIKLVNDKNEELQKKEVTLQ